MGPITDQFRATLDDLATYVEGAFSDTHPDLAIAWQVVLDPIREYLEHLEILPGLTARLIDVAGVNQHGEDDQRSAMRLEIRSRFIPDVAVHLTSEHLDGAPQVSTWAQLRHSATQSDQTWDALPAAAAIIRFIDEHNERVPAFPDIHP